MRKIVKTTALAAALGLGTIAAAQGRLGTERDYYPYNFTVRAGVALPLDGAISDNIGSTLTALGVEYEFGRPLLKNGETYIALEYFTKAFKGDKGTIFPLTVNHRFYTGGTEGRRNYAFVGLGVAFVDVTSSNTAVAVRGGIGAELSENIIFETAAIVSDKAGGASANSVSFYLGYRF